MRIAKNVLCNGTNVGKAKGYYEDDKKYTFVIDGKDINFNKSEYKLSINQAEYTLNDIVMICNKSIPCCGCSKMETCTLKKL